MLLTVARISVALGAVSDLFGRSLAAPIAPQRAGRQHSAREPLYIYPDETNGEIAFRVSRHNENPNFHPRQLKNAKRILQFNLPGTLSNQESAPYWIPAGKGGTVVLGSIDTLKAVQWKLENSEALKAAMQNLTLGGANTQSFKVNFGKDTEQPKEIVIKPPPQDGEEPLTRLRPGADSAGGVVYAGKITKPVDPVGSGLKPEEMLDGYVQKKPVLGNPKYSFGNKPPIAIGGDKSGGTPLTVTTGGLKLTGSNDSKKLGLDVQQVSVGQSGTLNLDDSPKIKGVDAKNIPSIDIATPVSKIGATPTNDDGITTITAKVNINMNADGSRTITPVLSPEASGADLTTLMQGNKPVKIILDTGGKHIPGGTKLTILNNQNNPLDNNMPPGISISKDHMSITLNQGSNFNVNAGETSSNAGNVTVAEGGLNLSGDTTVELSGGTISDVQSQQAQGGNQTPPNPPSVSSSGQLIVGGDPDTSAVTGSTIYLGSSTITTGSIGKISGGQTLTLNNNGGAQFTGATSVAGSLTLNGQGTLAGGNTYSGGSIVINPSSDQTLNSGKLTVGKRRFKLLDAVASSAQDGQPMATIDDATKLQIRFAVELDNRRVGEIQVVSKPDKRGFNVAYGFSPLEYSRKAEEQAEERGEEGLDIEEALDVDGLIDFKQALDIAREYNNDQGPLKRVTRIELKPVASICSEVDSRGATQRLAYRVTLEDGDQVFIGAYGASLPCKSSGK